LGLGFGVLGSWGLVFGGWEFWVLSFFSRCFGFEAIPLRPKALTTQPQTLTTKLATTQPVLPRACGLKCQCSSAACHVTHECNCSRHTTSAATHHVCSLQQLGFMSECSCKSTASSRHALRCKPSAAPPLSFASTLARRARTPPPLPHPQPPPPSTNPPLHPHPHPPHRRT
jgi:hypothetical protein